MRVQVPRALGKLKKLHGSTPVEAREDEGWVASWALGGRPGSEPSERGHLDSGYMRHAICIWKLLCKRQNRNSFKKNFFHCTVGSWKRKETLVEELVTPK